MFWAQARDVSGRLSEEARFAFTILPPWYRTWWAYGLFVLLVGGVLAGSRHFIEEAWRLKQRTGGAMRLTTARYYTPNNRSIQAAGIYPDIEVFQDVPEEFRGRDEIVGEAALPGHIGGGTEEEATTGSSVYVPADRTADSQLNHAIDLILGEKTDPAFPPKPDL